MHQIFRQWYHIKVTTGLFYGNRFATYDAGKAYGYDKPTKYHLDVNKLIANKIFRVSLLLSEPKKLGYTLYTYNWPRVIVRLDLFQFKNKYIVWVVFVCVFDLYRKMFYFSDWLKKCFCLVQKSVCTLRSSPRLWIWYIVYSFSGFSINIANRYINQRKSVLGRRWQRLFTFFNNKIIHNKGMRKSFYVSLSWV